DIRPNRQRAIDIHQLCPLLVCQGQLHARRRVVKRILSDLPEVGVLITHSAQPRVLELARAPETGALRTLSGELLFDAKGDLACVEDDKSIKRDSADAQIVYDRLSHCPLGCYGCSSQCRCQRVHKVSAFHRMDSLMEGTAISRDLFHLSPDHEVPQRS